MAGDFDESAPTAGEERALHEQLRAETFQDIGKAHDWRNHIGEDLAGIWDTFTDAQRAVLYRDAQARADNEEWD